MNAEGAKFLREHVSITRRYFLRSGTAGAAAMCCLPMFADGAERDGELQKVIESNRF